MVINTQEGLVIFLERFKAATEYIGLEFPKNITLEIDNLSLKKEIEGSMQTVHGHNKITMDRGEYMGVKICFKEDK